MDYCLYYARLIIDYARLWMIRMIMIGVLIFALPLIVFLSIKYRQKKRHQKRTEEKTAKNGTDLRKEAPSKTEISVSPDSEPGLQRTSEETRERVKANQEHNTVRKDAIDEEHSVVTNSINNASIINSKGKSDEKTSDNDLENQSFSWILKAAEQGQKHVR